MDKFIMKTRVYMGQGALECLNEFDIHRVFIICDPFMKTSGMVEQVTAMLQQRGVTFEIYADVKPNPDVTIIKEVFRYAVQFKPDAIISMGGGSAIDVGKSIDYLYRRRESHINICTIAIPTTSGTGSEVTSAAVITDQRDNVKIPFSDRSIIPDVAILDPSLTVSVPASVTADTGMDVFTHALEAFVGKKRNDFTDASGEKALKLVWENLEKCVRDGTDIDARMHMHNASCLAGIAFNAAGVGLCHSLAHAFGEQFHVSHGRANAMLLPFVIAYNAGVDSEKDSESLMLYVKAANLLGISSGTPKGTVHIFINRLRNFEKKIGIPQHLSELGISIEDFNQNLTQMTLHAINDPCNDTNPVVPSLDDITSIFEQFRDY